MSHTETRVNGIDVSMWDEATDRMGVQSDARALAGSLPRGGELEGQDGYVDEIDGPSYPGGELTVWFKGQVINFEAPDGYYITSVSLFDGDYNCVTLKQE